MNTSSIKNAAESALHDANRVTFGDNLFSKEQMEAIAKAVVAAVEEYDRQKG